MIGYALKGWWVQILEAGLKQGISPASFLGCLLFLLLVFHVQRQFGFGAFFGAFLLFLIFIVQTVVHLVVSDYLYVVFPSVLLLLDGIRIAAAIGMLVFGFMLFRKICLGKGWGLRDFSRVLTQRPVVSFVRKGVWWLSSFLWALFFALFCGTWLLNDQAVQVYDQWAHHSSTEAVWQFFVFEFLTLCPFFVSLFVLASIFHSEKMRKRILEDRMFMLFFSGICVAGASSVLLYYFNFFF